MEAEAFQWCQTTGYPTFFAFSVLSCNQTITLHIWGIKPISSFILAPSLLFFVSECGHVGVGAFDVLC